MTALMHSGAAAFEELCHFEVLGNPAAQGSKKAWVNPKTGRAQMREQAGDKLDDWRSAVAAAAYNAAHQRPPSTRHDPDGVPYDGPLALVVVFRCPVPALRRKACVEAGGRLPKTTAPDFDKLTRALADGLTAGGLITDDARIYSCMTEKFEVSGWTGAEVWLSRRLA